MKTEYVIVISEKDCADGVRNNERFCVVSTAIGRLQPEATRIEVNVNTIRFSLKNDAGDTCRLAYRTPHVVRDYIKAFDAGAEPKPMRFTLADPEIVVKEPRPKLAAKTVSFKPKEPAATRRSIRVFGEKAFVPNS